MPIKIDIADDCKIDVGDSKRLDITPRDDSGAEIEVQQIVVTVTPPSGDDIVYRLGGAGEGELPVEQDDGSHYVVIDFDAQGLWAIDVVATDEHGNDERTSTRDDPVYVRPKP